MTFVTGTAEEVEDTLVGQGSVGEFRKGQAVCEWRIREFADNTSWTKRVNKTSRTLHRTTTNEGDGAYSQPHTGFIAGDTHVFGPSLTVYT